MARRGRKKGGESPSTAGSQAAPFPSNPMFKDKMGKKFLFLFYLEMVSLYGSGWP